MPNDPEWGQFQAQWLVCWCCVPLLALLPSAKYRLTIVTSARGAKSHADLARSCWMHERQFSCQMPLMTTIFIPKRGICCLMQICPTHLKTTKLARWYHSWWLNFFFFSFPVCDFFFSFSPTFLSIYKKNKPGVCYISTAAASQTLD